MRFASCTLTSLRYMSFFSRPLLRYILLLALLAAYGPIDAHAALYSELGVGTEGQQVLELQSALAKMGYLKAQPTGYFGPLTQDAVRSFQFMNAIAVSGKTDATTRSIINVYVQRNQEITATPPPPFAPMPNASAGAGSFVSYLSVGSQGLQVSSLQALLQRLGYLAVAPTGYFGPLTHQAVAALQRDHGLEQVGATGPLTRALLTRLATTPSTPSSGGTAPASQDDDRDKDEDEDERREEDEEDDSESKRSKPILSTVDPSELRIRVGAPQVVRGPAPDESDTSFNAIRLPNGRFRGFSSNNSTYAIDGNSITSLTGARTEVRSPGTASSYDGCGNWLNATFASGKLLYGFFHSERACDYGKGGQTHKSMAIAVSTDQGLTWRSLGQVITGEDVPKAGRITGEGDCGLAQPGDGYVYAYCLRNSDSKTIAVRAPENNPVPGNWYKWDGSGWNAPGLGGRAVPVSGGGGGTTFWKPGNAIVSVSSNKWFGGIRLSMSKDPLTFRNLEEPLVPFDDNVWVRPAPTEFGAYVSLLDSRRGSGQLSSDDLLLTYTYIPQGKGFASRYLVMHEVEMTDDYRGEGPQVGLALTAWKDPDERRRTSSGVVLGGYTRERLLGYLLTEADERAATVKLEECVSTWAGHSDYLLTGHGKCAGEGYTRLRTAGWVYTAQQPNTLPLYRCYAAATQYHFASTNPQCDGIGTMEWLLGYLLRD